MSASMAPDSGPSRLAAAPRPRVSKACIRCRGRKIRCDGNPGACGFCSSNNLECEYAESNDHAAGARKADEELRRLQARVDALEEANLEMGAMREWFKWSNGGTTAPFQQGSASPAVSTAPPTLLRAARTYTPIASLQQELSAAARQTLSQDSSGRRAQSWHDQLSHYARDADGRLRYMGGASSLILLEALKSLQPDSVVDAPPPSSADGNSDSAPTNLDHPFFPNGSHFRPVEGLPTVESTILPDPATADGLVESYFRGIHPTTPILQKQHFLTKYFSAMEQQSAGEPQKESDGPFLSVLFAVFSLGSAYEGRRSGTEAGSGTARGLEYYERAKIIYWASSELPVIEHVQCQALLATWLSGANALAQAWIVVGTALRVAQDLGLHRSPARLNIDLMDAEVGRRVWWTLYGLDRILSLSLGRPFGVLDDDCDVELPAEVVGRDYTAGFKALSEAKVLAGKVIRAAQSVAFLRSIDNATNGGEAMHGVVATLDAMLYDWLSTLPDLIPASLVGAGSLELRISAFLALYIHHASIINLHRPLISMALSGSAEDSSLQKCLRAARSCLDLAEQLHPLLPTTHYLIFVTQYVTTSGVILLRSVNHASDPTVISTAFEEAERCCALLTAIEVTWIGARRCREIVQHLLFALMNRWVERFEKSGTLNSTPGTSFTSGRKRPAEDEAEQRARPSQFAGSSTSQDGFDYSCGDLGLGQGTANVFDFDLDAFALGNSTDSLPHGFNFLNSDLPSFILETAT